MSTLAVVRVLVVLIGAGGAGGLAGSIVGAAIGDRSALFMGGIAGGLISSPAAVWLCGRVGWIAASDVRGMAIGATLGFGAAVLVATNTLSSPVGPLLSPLLVGIGAFVGRRLGHGSRRAETPENSPSTEVKP